MRHVWQTPVIQVRDAQTEVPAQEPPTLKADLRRSLGAGLSGAWQGEARPIGPAHLLALQRTIGNRAVSQIVGTSRTGRRSATTTSQIVRTPGTRPQLATTTTQNVRTPSARPRLATTTVQRVLQRAVSSGCFAPSEVVDTLVSSPFGTVAETVVEDDYMTQMGGTRFGDVFLDNPLGPMSYVAFLKRHHPSLNEWSLTAQMGLSGGVLVPDILDTRSISREVPEFYDVKPNSVDGRAAGRGKLAAIDAFMSFNSLPYERGDSYTPTGSISLPMTSAAFSAAIVALGGAAVLPMILACGLPTVSLEVTRPRRGLLLYRVCVQADFGCYVRVLALQVILAAIVLAIILIITGRMPAPQPVPPPQLPAPSPIPSPIPPVPMPVPVPVPSSTGDEGNDGSVWFDF